MKRTKVINVIRHIPILHNIIFGIIRFFNLRFSTCSKCGLPWNWCNSKSVSTSEYSGTFATCDYCWDNSTLEEIKQCYIETYYMQRNSLMGSGYPMKHILGHLLGCVVIEFNKRYKNSCNI